ncbi:MAG: hypothetical protein OXI54_10525 [Chloroflexota bacterium]|nr:hypothetical protein [Chloroflexota bacterium]
MLNPVHNVNTAGDPPTAVNDLARLSELLEEYGHGGPFRSQADPQGSKDSIVTMVTDPGTQSVPREGFDLREALRRRIAQAASTVVFVAAPHHEPTNEFSPHFFGELGHQDYGGLGIFHMGAAGFRTSIPYRLPQTGWWHQTDAVINQTPVTENVESARSEIQALHQTVNELSDKVQVLEELVAEAHQVLTAFSQSYYWTPEWQAKEERADEDDRLGRSRQYESVEDLIADLNE